MLYVASKKLATQRSKCGRMSNFQQNLFISFHGILLLVINILTVRNSMPIISTSLQVDEAM